jgi:dUTP pyrophosphatase
MMGGAYLAYPIDQRGPASLVHMFDMIEYCKQKLLADQAVSWVYDPGDAFTVDSRAVIDDSLARVNRAALNNADIVLAWLPSNIATVGVPMEIDRAVSQGKHVFIFSDAPSWMLQYPSMLVTRFADHDEGTINKAVEIAAKLHSPVESRHQEDLRVKLGDGGQLPVRHYEDDAGLDLIVSRHTVIKPGRFEDVPCGISVELPPWAWGLVTGRSSALRKKGLLVHSGVIDAGYRGPLFAGAWNMTDKAVAVDRGERIAQLIVLNNNTRYVEPIVARELFPSKRGTAGFGSTGA